jgi:serine/threonine protein kinase
MNWMLLTGRDDDYFFDVDQVPRMGGMSNVLCGYRLSDMRIALDPSNRGAQRNAALFQLQGIQRNRLFRVDKLPNARALAHELGQLAAAPQVQTIAIKVLLRELAAQPMYRERFIRESKIKIYHPNVVQIHEYIQVPDGQGGRHHIVMEYLQGISLEDRIKKGAEPLPESDALDIARQSLEGLRALHTETRATHRDIKPGNLMCCHDGKVKVMDFGVAKPEEGSAYGTLTGIATFIGTPTYASPEQVRMLNSSVSFPSDFWGIGIVLYEMLVGQPPFTGRNDEEVKAKILEWPTPNAPGIAPAINKIIQRATQKEAAHRYQSADEFIADIDRVLHPEISGNSKPSKLFVRPVPTLPEKIPDKSQLPNIAIISIVITIIIILIFIFNHFR